MEKKHCYGMWSHCVSCKCRGNRLQCYSMCCHLIWVGYYMSHVSRLQSAGVIYKVAAET